MNDDIDKPFSDLALDASVLEALDQMGFKNMTPVQELSIPHLLTSVDFLGQAPTGTGKTAAFAIPLVNRIEPGSGYVQALIIGPTRELVQQIAKEINEIGKVKGVKALAVFGGERIYGQRKQLREEKIDIIVGTPGRLIDHIEQASFSFTRIRLVVLDESDVMLDMGFIEDIEKILARTPRGRQTWLFSATMSPESRRIADKHMLYPEEIRIAPQKHSSEMIDQYYFIAEDNEKVPLIQNLLENTPDIYGIIFCRTKKGVVELTRKLRGRYPVECVHGAMEQSSRDAVLNKFRTKDYTVIVATDVLARGIDIDNLTHIINFDPPNDPDSYIHRIGRTARAGETGIAITFFTPDEGGEYTQLEKEVGMALMKHPESQVEFRATRRRSGGYRRSSSSYKGKGSHSSSGGQPRKRY